MAVRIARSVTLHGVNWYCDASVELAEIEGEIRPDTWPTAVALVDRLLPPGIDRSALTQPADAVGAVASLSAGICRWGGFPAHPIPPRAGADAGSRWVALPVRCLPMMRIALSIAAEALDLIERGDDGEAWLPRARETILAVKAQADLWMAGSRRLIAAAAAARGIPCRVHSGLTSMLVLGEGRHGHRYDASATPRSGALATTIGISKHRTNIMLARGGIPVARQAMLADREAARRASERFGFPFVIKPTGGRLQQGVAIVFRAQDVEPAFEACAATGMDVLAESFIPGREFRALVVGGSLVSVIEQVAARVVGDGRSTIEELVGIANLDRRRGLVAHGCPMRPIAWNDTTQRFLEFSGRTPADVPREGEVVQTYPLPMLRYGGELKVDVTDNVHPDTVAMLERAVEIIGLDVAGIDVRTPDIARSWRDVGAGLCEINPQPNLAIHYSLSAAVRRDVAGMLLDRTLPAFPGRMTHVAVIGGAGSDALAVAIREALALSRGWRVGLVTPKRVELDGYPVARPPRRFEEIVGLLIEDPTLDAGVYSVSPEIVARFGLALGHLDVALLGPVNPAEDRQARVVRETVAAAGAAAIAIGARPIPELVDLVLAHLDEARHRRLEGAGAAS